MEPMISGGFEPAIEGGLKKCKKGFARSRVNGRCHKANYKPKCPYGTTYDSTIKGCRFKRSGGIVPGVSARSRLISPSRYGISPAGVSPSGRTIPYVIMKSPSTRKLARTPGGRRYRKTYITYKSGSARKYSVRK